MQGKLDVIVQKGYLPAELPPPFSTESLVHHLPLLRKLLDQLDERQSECGLHSIPKKGGGRRNVYIPNPRQHIQLSRALAIQVAYYKAAPAQRSYRSLSRIAKAQTRAYKPRFHFSELQKQRVLLSTGSRYLLQLDIEQFYESISTSRVAEVLQAMPPELQKLSRKQLLKTNIPNLLKLSNTGRTTGIPVGPDTSFLIAEMVGTAIDKRIQDELPSAKGIRYIDDFYFYVKDEEEAGHITHVVEDILDSFDLKLNDSKRQLLPMPERIVAGWSSQLRAYDYSKSGVSAQQMELLRYYSDVSDLFHQYPGESVMKFGVSRISNLYVHKANWPLYEALLLRSAMADPRTLAVINRILFTYADKFDYALNKEKISSTLSQIVIQYGREGSGFETAWAIWTCLTLRVDVSEEAAGVIAKMDDPVVALLALDLIDQGFMKAEHSFTERWKTRMTGDDLYGPYWLVAYQAAVNEWLPVSEDYMQQDVFFDQLRSWNVHFYDPDPTQYYLPILQHAEDEEPAEQDDDFIFFEY